MIAQAFYRQLPEWARPTHPMMQYILGRQATTRRSRWLRALLVMLSVGLAVAVSYFAVLQNNDTPRIREILYYPLVALTLLMQVLTLAITTNSIALERQKQTWDSLQISLVGAATNIRARWVSIFYRLRLMLLVVFAARLVYIALLMVDMTDFEGRAIDVRIIGISPEVSLEVAVFLLAALMTAAIVQPFVALAFDSAIGMLVAVFTQQRSVGILTTVVLMGARIILTLGAVIQGNQVVNANGTTPAILENSTEQAWAQVLLLSTQGDLSLRLLNLETLGNLWADLDNGIYLGGVVLAVVMLQAAVANSLVLLAAWRAAKPNRY